MIRNRIDFSCIDCPLLLYVDFPRTYECGVTERRLPDTAECMRCKFERQLRKEKKIREKVKYGRC